jgi:cell division protein FtsI (penicillin-binding protein 3)
MGLKDAMYILENRGFKVNFSGNGKVIAQDPPAGTPATGEVALTLEHDSKEIN